MEEIGIKLAYGFVALCKAGLTLFVERVSFLAAKDMIESELELRKEAQSSGRLSQD